MKPELTSRELEIMQLQIAMTRTAERLINARLQVDNINRKLAAQEAELRFQKMLQNFNVPSFHRHERSLVGVREIVTDGTIQKGDIIRWTDTNIIEAASNFIGRPVNWDPHMEVYRPITSPVSK